MKPFYLKAGDKTELHRKVVVKLDGTFELVDVEDDDFTAYDLDGATVTFSMVSVAGVAVIDKDEVTNGSPSEDGKFHYTFDGAQTPGRYDGEFRVLNSPDDFRLPVKGHIEIVVGEAIT